MKAHASRAATARAKTSRASLMRWRSALGTCSMSALKARRASAVTASATRFPFGVSRTSVCRPSEASRLRAMSPARCKPARFRLAVEGSIPRSWASADVETTPLASISSRASACCGVMFAPRARSRPILPRPRAQTWTARARRSESAMVGAACTPQGLVGRQDTAVQRPASETAWGTAASNVDASGARNPSSACEKGVM